MPVPGVWALTEAWGLLLAFSSSGSQPLQKHVGKACCLGYINCTSRDEKPLVQDRRRGKGGCELENKWERQGQLYQSLWACTKVVVFATSSSNLGNEFPCLLTVKEWLVTETHFQKIYSIAPLGEQVYKVFVGLQGSFNSIGSSENDVAYQSRPRIGLDVQKKWSISLSVKIAGGSLVYMIHNWDDLLSRDNKPYSSVLWFKFTFSPDTSEGALLGDIEKSNSDFFNVLKIILINHNHNNPFTSV